MKLHYALYIIKRRPRRTDAHQNIILTKSKLHNRNSITKVHNIMGFVKQTPHYMQHVTALTSIT